MAALVVLLIILVLGFVGLARLFRFFQKGRSGRGLKVSMLVGAMVVAATGAVVGNWLDPTRPDVMLSGLLAGVLFVLGIPVGLVLGGLAWTVWPLLRRVGDVWRTT